jgi:HK97 gp10 family phage protein
MAGKAKIQITGLDDLHKNLRRLPQVVAAGARAAVKGETHDVAQEMRRDAPVLTGDLRQGIQERTSKGGLEGHAVSTARHTTFVIHGTSDTPANDFMEPAAQRSRRRFPKRVTKEIEDELGRLAK